MNAVVRSFVVGFILEVVTLICLIPGDSTRPATALRNSLGYTQVPGLSVLRLFGTVGEFLGPLPPGIGFLCGGAALLLVFLIQAGLFGSPLWLVWLAGTRKERGFHE